VIRYGTDGVGKARIAQTFGHLAQPVAGRLCWTEWTAIPARHVVTPAAGPYRGPRPLPSQGGVAYDDKNQNRQIRGPK
jgi:hypothetical protein